MSDFEFVTAGDEFRTVPQTGGWLRGETIGNGGDGECRPPQYSVDFREGFLSHLAVLLVGCGEGNKKSGCKGRKKPYNSLTFYLHHWFSVCCALLVS